MTLARNICRTLAVALLLAASGAQAAEPLRIARGLFPGSRGNPYGVAANNGWDLYSAIFDTLTRVLGTGEIVPWAAEKWAQMPDGAWRFTLRPNLRFGNGESFDAAAVVSVVDYLKSDAGRGESAAGLARTISEARAIDDQTIEFRLSNPDPLLPLRLSTLWIVAPKAWQDLGREKFGESPVGSGPYKVTSWKSQEVAMERSPASWRKAPTDKIYFYATPDPAGRNAALTSGLADIAVSSTEPSLFAAVEAIKGSIYPDALPAVVGIAFNTEKDARFRDVRVRQALNYAVNRDEIARTILEGQAKPASQIAPSGFFGFNRTLKPYPFDPARARQLLAEAGHPDGFKFDMELAQGGTLWNLVFLQVAQDLRNVGVEMTIRMVPQDIAMRYVQEGGWRGSAWGSAFFSAAFDGLEAIHQHSCLWHAPWFCDLDIAAAIQKADGTYDLEGRRLATQTVMALSHERAQALPVYESIGFIGLGPRVKGFRSDFGFYRYEQMEISP